MTATPNDIDVAALAAAAARLRGQVIAMSHKAGSAHLASALSCCDIVGPNAASAGASR